MSGARIGTIHRKKTAFCAAGTGASAMQAASARRIAIGAIPTMPAISGGFVSCFRAPLSLCTFTLFHNRARSAIFRLFLGFFLNG